VGQVNKLSSTKTQLPYDYYSLPFCRPAEVVNKMENLGEVLHGSVIKNSAYDISMGKIEFRVLCKRTLEPAEATLLHTRIRQDYRVHMIMDNLPAATKMIRELPDGQTIVMSAPALCPHTSAATSPPPPAHTPPPPPLHHPWLLRRYDRGYPLGFVGSAERQGSVPGGAYLHNHLRFESSREIPRDHPRSPEITRAAPTCTTTCPRTRFVLKYHKDAAFDGARIVGFEACNYSTATRPTPAPSLALHAVSPSSREGEPLSVDHTRGPPLGHISGTSRAQPPEARSFGQYEL